MWKYSELSLHALKRIDPLPKVQELYSDQKYFEAYEYLTFFMGYEYVYNNSSAHGLLDEIENERSSWSYRVSKFNEGVLTGYSDEDYGKIVGMITDLIVVGDIRDLAIQGKKIYMRKKSTNLW